MKTKKLAIAGFSAAMLLGGGTGLLMSMPGSASASSAAVVSPVAPVATDSTVAAGSDSGSDTGSDTRVPGERLTAALQPLVDAGTITADQSSALVTAVVAAHDAQEAAEAAGTATTPPVRGAFLTDTLAAQVSSGALTQAQSDAITAAVEAARPVGGPGGHGDHGGMGDHGRRGANLDVAATALGITPAELKTELDAGKTIAAVATEKGVDVQVVIDALVADQTANITSRITDMVNGVRPVRADDADADSAADSATATTDTASTTG